MRLTIDEAAKIVRGDVATPDPSVSINGASIDSRRVKPGDLFFALKGESLDGHDFVRDALLKNAAAAVVTELRTEADPRRQIVVKNGIAALAALAEWVREVENPMVVGITGSTGKTSVKDLLAAILRPHRNVVASHGSFNNELGLPLTLLSIRPETDVVVCEMGARGLGQIKVLCDLARPNVGAVTNVGVTHFELFGSREAIANTKAELVRSLPQGGAAVLNADDPLVRAMAGETTAEVLTFGSGKDAWLRAEAVTSDALGRPSFRMVRGDEHVWVRLGVSGLHQVANSLAASACALVLGLTLEQCREGLLTAELSPWRMETRRVEGIVVVNDAYNASPTSTASALTTCASMALEGSRVVAVLGYMAELGEIEAAEHRRIGALAAASVSRLVVVGERAAPIAEGAFEAGVGELVQVAAPEDAAEAVGELSAGDVVLVKGSRVAGLEKVAELIQARLSTA